MASESEAALLERGLTALLSSLGLRSADWLWPMEEPRVAAVWYALWSRGLIAGSLVENRSFLTGDRGGESLRRHPGPGRARPTSGTIREPTATYGARAPSASVADLVDAYGMIADDPSMQAVVETVEAVAAHPVPVLLQGETGTGKSQWAHILHDAGRNVSEPFVPVNCAAIPDTLMESHLFGHRKGAFTGADRDQEGKFSQAEGGTLFLDEIGELPLALQPKLLKVLDDGIVEPLGATGGRKVHVRVLSATHRDLREAVDEGSFREDLFYRLTFAVIRIPRLSDRRDDIPKLALRCLEQMNRNLEAPRFFSAEAMQRLCAHPWPGNVRQLENVVGRSVLLARKPELGVDDLLFDAEKAAPDRPIVPVIHDGFELEEYLQSVRQELFAQALGAAKGNRSAAARMLGVSPQAVSNFLRRDGGK